MSAHSLLLLLNQVIATFRQEKSIFVLKIKLAYPKYDIYLVSYLIAGSRYMIDIVLSKDTDPLTKE